VCRSHILVQATDILTSAQTRKTLGTAFEKIGQLPRLDTISLGFHSNFDDMHRPQRSYPRFRWEQDRELQLSILSALFNSRWSSSEGSHTLILHNLLDFDGHTYLEEAVRSLFGSLSAFHVCFTSEPIAWRTDLDFPDVHPSLFRHPIFMYRVLLDTSLFANAPLTSVSLSSEFYVGDSPGLQLSPLHFPSLTSISLRRIHFNSLSGAEAFVLNHKAKLISLTLEHCAIIVDEPQLRLWGQVYKVFQEELRSLVDLDVVHAEIRPYSPVQGVIDVGPYHVEDWWDDASGMSEMGWAAPHPDEFSPEIIVDDRSALAALMATVNERRGGSGNFCV
jgi:hypothetical protein